MLFQLSLILSGLDFYLFYCFKFNELDERQIKLTTEFKAYQQRFQYTHEDIHSRENRISQMEYELEDVANQLEMSKSHLQDLQNSNANLKSDYDTLLEAKRNTDREITRLETTVSELQMDFTSNHQQLKKEVRLKL
jgi:chromosome segregation ATPase